MREALLPAGCVVVVGLLSEAALLPKGTRILVSGGRSAHLGSMMTALPASVTAVLSFGLAGGLAPALPSGALLAAQWVHAGAKRYETDQHWLEVLTRQTSAISAGIAASETILATAGEKAILHERTGAAAVDMESGVAAIFAAQRGLPFAALRAIADGAGDAVPRVAACGLNPDGSVAAYRVLAALLAHPRELPELIRLARASGKAHAALRRALR